MEQLTENFESILLMEDMVDVGSKKCFHSWAWITQLSYRYTTFTRITTHLSISGITGTLLCHPTGRYRAGFDSGFWDRDGYTLCGEVKRRGWWCRMPTAGLVAATAHVVVDTWPAHQLICMRAQLFISSSSVSCFVILLLTFFN